MRTLNQVVLEAVRASSDTIEIEHRRRTTFIRQNETLVWKAASTAVHESSGLTYGTLGRSCQQIRLFELLPGTGMTDVVGGFHCIDLSKCPTYTALSYAWGDQTDSENMKIDGGTTISVRKNLWWFLHLQQSTITQPKLFWIDAMCINQDDVHERNHQVGLMKLIYATAADVCIWLGRESEDSDLAMEFIAKKGTHGLRARGPGFHPLWKKKEGLALAALCDRPYWTRMWIIQEIIHAKKITVWCGAKEFNWASFKSLYLSLKVLEDNSWDAHHYLVTNVLQSSACVMVWQRAHWRHPDTPIPSLQTLIEVFHEWKCADVRDKVYALVGMANNETSIMPDYERSLKQLYFAVQERNPSCEEKFFNLLSQVLVLPGKDIELPGQSLIEYKSHPPERIVLRKRMNDENW
ncbi:heterokaryon incompatibility protein-domain-containing protein [Leptodontidium sp. MPI-SDFR-AT-0119]|nr:heterokaryon incompatibility protein-domain-containing protein [Leptodontidium sp. MPI-SDFR-AT-0119]